MAALVIAAVRADAREPTINMMSVKAKNPT
jgi:hypothetical protein